MKEKREFWIGEADFKEIIKNNGYYVDKTLLIDNIYRERGIKVKLFTRPRRFGKTLNLSMIRHFFDLKTAEENKDLFKGLNIEKTETMKEFGKYPVIFMTLKSLVSKGMEENQQRLRNMISNLYTENECVKEVLRKDELMEYEAISTKKDGDYAAAIGKLIKYLYRYYGKEVILLIDEYDTPLIKAYIKGYYEDVIDFYRVMFQEALKDTEGLKFAVLTGITRIARENIFSGLNNIEVYSVLAEDYEDFFGFTEKEVEAGLKEYEIENSLENVKTWYNGYNFNRKSIYNPWSILSFLKKKKLIPYWINTSGNELIIDSLNRFWSREMLETLEGLFNGKSVTVSVNENVTFKNLKKTNEVWNLMLNSGYLTVKNKETSKIYELKIPNYEIETFFRETFIQEFLEDSEEKFEIIMRDLPKGKTEEFERKFKKFIFDTISFSERDKEGLAHGIILGMVSALKETHYTKSEREAGYGRFDVYVEPKKKDGFGYVIETKVVKEIKATKSKKGKKNKKNTNDVSEKLKKEAELAVEQIKERAYYAELMERDIENISLIGIVFCGKNVEVSVEKVR